MTSLNVHLPSGIGYTKVNKADKIELTIVEELTDQSDGQNACLNGMIFFCKDHNNNLGMALCLDCQWSEVSSVSFG